ncbi:FAD-binding oxidoreductase [Nocardia transvalensis]|uniref:FAD-binding oxidoreductase n=1 Tax=Nocardia transvalensis TaxID=37333 RepID=UPI001892E624|nr:FAD-binding oxidoreductase [Nocardia transvalensis]MBF6332231.1 FAD-binding oxidoreductase [Nocardia transvalensis]
MAETVGPTFSGRLYLSGDPGYDEAVVDRVFNARLPQHRPAAVLQAATDQDVVAGVRLARARGWKVAVRAGGHSWDSCSVRDGGLLIDVGGLKDLAYDAENAIVSAGPAVNGGELSPFLARYSRFFNGGHCPQVGLGGFLLQGGLGWNARGWGWAAEHIAAIDVVTAGGELVRASETENSDLFWAAWGSGPGFFGVVTRFHLRTVSLPQALHETVHTYPGELYDEVMTWLYEVHTTISPDVEVVALAQTTPEPIDGYTGQVVVVSGLALVDTSAQASEALAPYTTCPVLDQALSRVDAAPTTLDVQYDRQRAAYPGGCRFAVDNAWVDGPTEVAVPAMRSAFIDLVTDRTLSTLISMGPTRELPDMALSVQTDFLLATYAVYDDPAQDDQVRSWLDGVMADLAPVSAGQQLGHLDIANRDRANRPLRVFGEAQSQRLDRIRAERDPDGLFPIYPS